ncbi:MAG TPA: hypothetical protein VEH27_09850 [Methylomirabilota bacterium]|nr:hypothetical protein [Methylomirabilota bacterium]
MNILQLKPLLAAGLDPAVTPVNRGGGLPGWLFSDLFLILLAGLVLGALIAIGIKFALKPKSPSVKGRVRQEIIEKDGETILRVKKRNRRRRRDHRQRNPTLSETGGLPPQRPEGAIPKGL